MRRYLTAIVTALVLALSSLPASVSGETIQGHIADYDCSFFSLGIPCMNLPEWLDGVLFAGGGGQSPITQTFNAFLFLMLVVYGLRLIARARSEDAIQEAVSAYTNALIGAAIASVSVNLAEAFANGSGAPLAATYQGCTGGGGGGGFNLPNLTPVADVLWTFITFISNIAYALLVLNIVIQSFRIVIAQDDGSIDSARQNLIRSFIGAILLRIAETTVLAICPDNPNLLANALVGVANFFVTIFGALAVIGFIVAGIMLVISIDESLKERAKKLLIASAAALIVVLLARAIVTFFT